MDISATESPLDVLSRAATMIQDNTFNTLPPSYDEAREFLKCKESAASGGKWTKPSRTVKEQRRSTRHTTGGVATAALPSHNAALPMNSTTSNNNSLVHHPEPIDMSITKKLRGSPPSYQQSVQFIQLAQAAAGVGSVGPRPHRPSVITSCSGNSNNSNNSSDLSDGDGVCDSVVDEHFRRSLGKDYSSVFSSNSNKSSLTVNGRQSESFTEEIGSSLSAVEAHFAKALGETWLKLQEQENQNKMKDGTESTTPMEQVQDVSTSDTTLSVINTKATEEKTTIEKSLLRHDRRLP